MTERARYSLDQLDTVLRHLRRMRRYLAESLKICEALVAKPTPTDLDYREFEALTSRYARLFDVLTRKAFRILLRLESEDAETLIDLGNAMEKRRLVDSSDQLFSLRVLRNEVTHEYAEERIQQLSQEVVEAAPQLLDIADRTLRYGEDLSASLRH